MQLTSSQRWAVGAVGLAILIACSPQKPDGAPVPLPNEPTLSGAPAGDIVPPPPPVTGGDVIAPGFAGRWAAADTECSDTAKTSTFQLTISPFQAGTPARLPISRKSIQPDGRRSSA